jgi:hypothetical protein
MYSYQYQYQHHTVNDDIFSFHIRGLKSGTSSHILTHPIHLRCLSSTRLSNLRARIKTREYGVILGTLPECNQGRTIVEGVKIICLNRICHYNNDGNKFDWDDNKE